MSLAFLVQKLLVRNSFYKKKLFWHFLHPYSSQLKLSQFCRHVCKRAAKRHQMLFKCHSTYNRFWYNGTFLKNYDISVIFYLWWPLLTSILTSHQNDPVKIVGLLTIYLMPFTTCRYVACSKNHLTQMVRPNNTSRKTPILANFGFTSTFTAILGKIHVVTNTADVVAWLRREFQGASGIIWLATNSVH